MWLVAMATEDVFFIFSLVCGLVYPQEFLKRYFSKCSILALGKRYLGKDLRAMYLKFSGILVLNEIIEISIGICQRIHSKEMIQQRVTKIWTYNLRHVV